MYPGIFKGAIYILYGLPVCFNLHNHLSPYQRLIPSVRDHIEINKFRDLNPVCLTSVFEPLFLLLLPVILSNHFHNLVTYVLLAPVYKRAN